MGKRQVKPQYTILPPWGNVISAEESDQVKDNPYRYAGYQYDQETGLYYLIARYYQPEHGVFLSLDPHTGDSDGLLSQNGYRGTGIDADYRHW